MDKQKEVLDLAVRVGEVLLQNGGEIFRVQETMHRIAEAYGVRDIHVYVLANGLFASVEDTEGPGAQYVRHLDTDEEIGQSAGGSQVRYLPLSATHLGRVAAVNDLSRQIAAHKYTIEEAWKRIEEISTMPFINEKVQILMSGLGAASICIIMGGSFWDSVASFISGILLWCFILYHSRKKSNKIMVNILGSALVTLNGIIMFRFFFGDNMDKIINQSTGRRRQACLFQKTTGFLAVPALFGGI